MTFSYSGSGGSNEDEGDRWFETWAREIPYWQAYQYVRFDFHCSNINDSWIFKINNNVYREGADPYHGSRGDYSMSVTYPIQLTQSYNTFTWGIWNMVFEYHLNDGVTTVTFYK